MDTVGLFGVALDDILGERAAGGSAAGAAVEVRQLGIDVLHLRHHRHRLGDVLVQTEDVLHKNLHQKSCRYAINKSIKSGISIRETTDSTRFVEVYYDQLLEVFKKQGLTPTYDKSCVSALVEALYPDNILLLEAITAEGDIAATGLFPGDKNMAIFWGGASYQRFQKLCPNEPLIWEAIKIWKERGTKVFDMCGVRPYKLKFGPVLYTKPRIMFARCRGLISAKRIIKKIYYGIRSFKAKLKG